MRREANTEAGSEGDRLLGVAKARKKYRIGRSGIEGRGVFATSRIRKNTRIVEYTGEILDLKEADRRAAIRERVYLFELENGTYIDGDPNAPGPIVNHSCAPNCFSAETDGRVFIVSARTIQPGEELTYDYLIRPGITRTCVCGAPDCRGTLNRKRGRGSRKRQKGSRKREARRS
jgi:SET domain-containing protein